MSGDVLGMIEKTHTSHVAFPEGLYPLFRTLEYEETEIVPQQRRAEETRHSAD